MIKNNAYTHLSPTPLACLWHCAPSPFIPIEDINPKNGSQLYASILKFLSNKKCAMHVLANVAQRGLNYISRGAYNMI